MTDLVPPEREEVIRLALVMNGGVSLAVWMGGVTHELNRALNRTPEDATSVWQEILAEPLNDKTEKRSRRVVVDYVAGSSAGGLNGALLATALGRGAELPDLLDLWVTKGRLQEAELLPAADSGGGSLLDGYFFHGAIKGVLGAIRHGSAGEPQDMSLLVTATAMTSAPKPIEDGYDHQINVSDHRRVYLFASASRSDDGDDAFAEDGQDELALAARASAGFPGAFSPVRETVELRRRRISPGGEPPTDAVWLMDGGVLDNAPFEPLLDEITRRPRADAGERWLVYVVPSAVGMRSEHGSPEGEKKGDGDRPGGDAAPPPDWVKVVTTALGLRGEFDLRSDMDTLRRLQASSRAAQWRPEDFVGDPSRPLPDVTDLLPMYRDTRAVGFVHFLDELGTKVEKFKRIDPAEEASALLAENPVFFPVDLQPARDGVWQWGVSVASRLALWMSRAAREAGVPVRVLAVLADVERSLVEPNRAVRAVYLKPMFKNSLAAYVARRSAPEATAAFGRTTQLMTQAVEAWAPAMGMTVPEAWRRLLTVEVLLNFAEWHERPAPPDFHVMLIDPGEKSVARFVSRGDEKLRKELESHPGDKLYGTRLGHFGAFGRESYREHDWVWGRIDAALCLAGALLKSTSGHRGDDLRDRLVAEILGTVEARDALVEETLEVMSMSDLDLGADILEGGEVDLLGLARTVDEALGTVWTHLPFDNVLDALGGKVRRSLHHAAGAVRDIVGRVGDGLHRAASRIHDVFTRD